MVNTGHVFDLDTDIYAMAFLIEEMEETTDEEFDGFNVEAAESRCDREEEISLNISILTYLIRNIYKKNRNF